MTQTQSALDLTIESLQQSIRRAKRQVAKGKKSGYLDSAHYHAQAELDRLNRALYALKSGMFL